MEKFQPTLSYNCGANQPVIESFTYFVEAFERLKTPVYGALIKAALDDANAQSIASECGPGQPIGMVFLSVVHYLLLSNPAEPLAAYFPSVTANAIPPDSKIPKLFAQFCEKYAQQMRPLVRNATLQTTSADRAATLLLALQPVVAEAGEPIDLIEIGCSAGLLLNFDRYAYDFGDAIPGAGIAGDRNSRVALPIELRLTTPLQSTRTPVIGDRVGLDLHPVDVSDIDQFNWVRAMIPPDHIPEQNRLKNALNLRAEIPVRLLKGDAMALIEAEAQKMKNTLCVFHSWCLYQWPAQALAEFERKIIAISQMRVVHRLSIEKDPNTQNASEVVHMVYANGELQRSRLIARADGFGRWVEWLGK